MGNAHESFGHDLTDGLFGLTDVGFGLMHEGSSIQLAVGSQKSSSLEYRA
ncbi:MAG: hypothetical protein ACX93O_08835 [Flagellimonas sp.]